jgi:hypothetical protein
MIVEREIGKYLEGSDNGLIAVKSRTLGEGATRKTKT